MEIRLKYINQDSFYGSDYFIKRVGYEEKWDRVKRLGDTYYENELLERSVTEKITKNTVIGNVEIGKSSGDEINRDLDTITEITEDRDFKTNINVESQTISYIKNPEKFKEDLQY